jgi:hypothetical protein
MQLSKSPPAPKHPNTVFSPYNLRSLQQKYLDCAKEANVHFIEETAFDSDITVFDRDPTEKALSWLLVAVCVGKFKF